MKTYQSLIFAATVVVIILAAALWAARPASAPAEQPKASDLKVNSSRQMFTNVAGGGLQPAAPPLDSATSSQATPQQASPNYCLPGEIPYVDGCVPR